MIGAKFANQSLATSMFKLQEGRLDQKIEYVRSKEAKIFHHLEVTVDTVSLYYSFVGSQSKILRLLPEISSA
jgi:hypothetical protein